MLRRTFSVIPQPVAATALHLFEKSCYFNLDFKINEEKVAREAVARFAAFNVGCLAVTNADNKVIGVLSGRDYIHKVAALGKNDNEVKVKDIATYGPSLIVAKSSDSLEICMQKMMFTPLKIYNGTPEGRLNIDLRETLPINELKGKSPMEICPILNLHRCKGIRHMIVVDDKSNECVGLISVKDVIREVLKDKNEAITRLTDFRVGKGAYFGSE